MTVSSLKLNRSRCVLMAALLLLAPSLGAQQTGTMTGQITDSRTGRPISAVQVYISALDLGTLTQLNGRYLLLGVSPGTYTLTAERIGYERVEQEVTIGTGGASAAVQDFMLNEDALQLDEIIVTGTPGGTLRRALGNSVARVDVSGIAQTLQAPNLDQLLASATPGLNAVLGMSGDVAGGARIRIRGASSAQLGSTPLLYVDGVRVNNQFTGRTRSFATPLQSRLNDFNPEDIESIEIVKGPSAATLYGTEASAGVIQIITKRGRTGAPQFDISVEGGTNFLLDPQGKIANTYWMFEDGTVETWNFMEQREKDRVAGLDNDWLRRGVGLDVTGSVRGGTDQVRYYVSGSSNNQEGFVDWNFNDMLQGRANIDVILSDNFDLAVSSMTMRSKHRAAQNPRPFSISNHVTYAHAGRVGSRGYYIAPPETERLVENGGEMNRFTSSLQLNHTAGPFRSRVIAGYDRTDQILNEFFPPVVEGADHPDLGSFGLGQLTRTDLGVDALALEFGSSARFDLSPAWVSETAVGVQYNSERTTTGGVLASDFAAVGLTAVGAAAVRNASGTFIEDKSLGVYVQQQFEWENRRFFTVAVRGDSHSAFGANIDPQIYPKVSGAWVLHEEPFWDVSVLSSFRLRGAWGKAGRQPATFAALTLYRPQTGSGGVPSFTPGSIGDPDLKPEIGTEIELGFDAGILDDRTTLEFTFYNKTTKDALLTITPPGSTGFVGDNSGRAITQFVNAGEVNNRGVELSIDTDLWQSGAKWWDLRISGAYNKNKLVSLGEVSETTGTSRLVEGYPIGGLWSKEIVDAEWVGDHLTGMPINPTCLQEDGSVLPCDLDSNRDDLFKGPGDPVWLGSVYTSFSVTDNLRFFANVDFKSGYHMRSTTIGATHGSLNNTLAVTGFPQGGAVYRHDGDNGPLSADGLLPDPRVRFGLLEGGRWGRAWSQFPAGFARLRQISAQYTLPPSLAGRIGADRASVTLSGNNLWYLWQQTDWWYGVRVGDPEIGANTGSGAQYLTGGGNSDLLTGSRVTMAVRVGF